MLTMLHTLGPLWRLCTVPLYRSRPGGAQGLQIPETEFDPLAACYRAGGQVGMASGCNPEDREFDSRSALHIVVMPTQGHRIGAYYPAPG